jgi:hypothetical protein
MLSNLPADISKEQIREIITQVEEAAKLSTEQIEIPIKHYFCKGGSGVYAREMFMPAGSLIVGKIHKHENMSIISAGEVSILSIDGLVRVKGPHTFVAQAGTKRLIYAHTDVVWTVLHGTSETNIEKLEEEFIAKDYSEVPQLELADVIQIETREKIAL